MDEMNHKLKPCPFCGSKAKFEGGYISVGKRTMFHIVCTNKACGLDAMWYGSEFSRKQQLIRWNHRESEVEK